jgi:ankyrin repeat protein
LYEAIAVALDDKHLKIPRFLLGNSYTVLESISFADMLKIIDILIEKDADIKKISMCSVIALGIHDEKKQTDMIMHLIKHKASVYDESWGTSFLFEVLRKYGHKGLFESMVASGIDLEHTYDSGVRLIHSLCEHYTCDNEYEKGIVDFILAKNIDVNSRNSDGETPLIILAKQKYGDIIEFAKMLIKKGADINLKDNSDNTALDHSIYTSQNNEMKEYLLSIGAQE